MRALISASSRARWRCRSKRRTAVVRRDGERRGGTRRGHQARTPSADRGADGGPRRWLRGSSRRRRARRARPGRRPAAACRSRRCRGRRRSRRRDCRAAGARSARPRLRPAAAGRMIRSGAARSATKTPPGLGDTRAPLGRRRDAARGKRRHDAVGEGQPRLGDVVAPRDDRGAGRLDRNDRRAGERQRQIDIVDHQVEDDVDIGGAARPRRPAHAFDQARRADPLAERAEGRREALDMADLEHASRACRRARPDRPRRRHRRRSASRRRHGCRRRSGRPATA